MVSVSFRWATSIGQHLTVMIEPSMIAGRLQCRSLIIEGDTEDVAVTSDLIREIPVGELVRLAANRLNLGDVESLPPKDFARNGMTEQALRNTLTVYQWCTQTGRKPLGVLERDYGIHRDAVARWIKRARHKWEQS